MAAPRRARAERAASRVLRSSEPSHPVGESNAAVTGGAIAALARRLKLSPEPTIRCSVLTPSPCCWCSQDMVICPTDIAERSTLC
jgi:hypothetical protein